MATRPISYAVLRGQVIESDLIEFGGRGGDITFLAPDPHTIAERIPLASPRLMEDLYELSFEDIERSLRLFTTKVMPELRDWDGNGTARRDEPVTAAVPTS